MSHTKKLKVEIGLSNPLQRPPIRYERVSNPLQEPSAPLNQWVVAWCCLIFDSFVFSVARGAYRINLIICHSCY